MDFQQLIESMSPDIYERLKQGVELGKWPNGQRLTKEQTAQSLQAVIAYEHRNMGDEERTGYLPPKPLKNTENNDPAQLNSLGEQPLNFK